jgi:hypothetical protein
VSKGGPNVQRRVTCLLLLLSLAPLSWSQSGTPGEKPGLRAVRAKDAEPEIWVEFVAIPNGAPVRQVGGGVGTLDLGQISYMGGATTEGVNIVRKAKSFVVSTRFGLKVGAASAAGTAKLIALVTQVNANSRVSVDGMRLTVMPQVVQMAAAYGAVGSHRLEIEIPIDAPEALARVAESIVFQVVAN